MQRDALASTGTDTVALCQAGHASVKSSSKFHSMTENVQMIGSIDGLIVEAVSVPVLARKILQTQTLLQ